MLDLYIYTTNNTHYNDLSGIGSDRIGSGSERGGFSFVFIRLLIWERLGGMRMGPPPPPPAARFIEYIVTHTTVQYIPRQLVSLALILLHDTTTVGSFLGEKSVADGKSRVFNFLVFRVYS